MKFEACSNLIIKNSCFLENNAFNQSGGCFHIEVNIIYLLLLNVCKI